MNPQATCQRHPTKHQHIPSSSYRPWPSNSFKRMAPTDAPQEPEEPIACALLDEWLQQLFTHHELWSNLTAAVAPCFRDVCGYSCKHVQTSRLTVRSCSLAWWLLDRHTCKDLQSVRWWSRSLTPLWTQVLEVVAPTWQHTESISNLSCKLWRLNLQATCHKRRFSYLTWEHPEWSPWQASEMNSHVTCQGCPAKRQRIPSRSYGQWQSNSFLFLAFGPKLWRLMYKLRDAEWNWISKIQAFS